MSKGKQDFGISILRDAMRHERKRMKAHLKRLRVIQGSSGTKLHATASFRSRLAKEIVQTEKLIKKLED